MAYSKEKDLFPFIGTDEDTDILLFFTDGESEPKKLNIRRCIEDNTNFSGNFLNYAGADLKDFISACPKTPEKPIRFSWAREAGKTSNFEDTNGFQFAYQNIYVDGFVSSISVVSEVSYPPAIQSLGAKSLTEVRVENTCILEIPKQGPEVDAVKILFREGNEGPFKLIDEVSNKNDLVNENMDFFNDDGVLGYYSFRNDTVYAIVPASQVSKNYDNLPRKAKAQTVSANRLMYGNYLDGFDNISTSAEVETVFESVTQKISDNLADSQQAVTMINVLTDHSRNNVSPNGDYPRLRGENAGFIIDVGEDNISKGVYRLSINVAPEKNFHLYSAQSYLSSRNQVFNQVQGFSEDPITYLNNNSDNLTVHGITNVPSGAYPVSNSGKNFLYGHLLGGKGVAELTWKTQNGSNTTVQLGTSPANPLILRGDSLDFDIELEVTEEVTAEDFMSAIDSVITSGDTNSSVIGFIEYTGNDINLGEFGFTSFEQTSGVFNILETNAGLNAGRRFSATDSNADLICKVPMEVAPTQNIAGFEEDWAGEGVIGAPMGFFIVNKAATIINVEPVVSPNGIDWSPIQNTGQDLQTSTRKYYRLVPRSMNVHIFAKLKTT